MPTQHTAPTLTDPDQTGTPPSTPSRVVAEESTEIIARLQSLLHQSEQNRKREQEEFAVQLQEAKNEAIKGNALHSGERTVTSGPIFLAAGGFGEIYGFPGTGIVYKQVIDALPETMDALRLEFDFANILYSLLGDSVESSSFRCPRPFVLYDPNSAELIHADPSPPRPVPSPHHRSSRNLYQAFEWSHFQRGTMVMDQIRSLNPAVSNAYKDLFFGHNIREQPIVLPLLRLYLGRTLAPFIHELKAIGATMTDLPLDIRRYERLREALEPMYQFPPLDGLSADMGRVLAVLHWGMGVDGSDIELVLGGGQNEIRPYVFDYNKCQRWSKSSPVHAESWDMAVPPETFSSQLCVDDPNYQGKTITEIAVKLAKRIGYAEFYYPRPSVDKTLYRHFREGYIAKVRRMLSERGGRMARKKEDEVAGFKGENMDGGRDAGQVIMEGVEAFFAEWERIDRDRTQDAAAKLNRPISTAFAEQLRNRSTN